MITIEKTSDLWLLGDVNGLKFEMKVYTTSCFGIKNGGIVKLFIYKWNFKTHHYDCVVQYDRGWYKRGRPKERRTVIALKELLEYVDKEKYMGMIMKYYKISEEDLTKLIEKAKFLDALEAGGVDNWYGYEMVEEHEYEVSEEDYEEYGATEIDDK